jgi:two-component system, OmpR family, osmolarity sensor histidine kinase EnvZ
MANRVSTDAVRRALAYLATGCAAAGLGLLLLQLLLGRRLEQAQLAQMGTQVSANLLLGEVALERFSPEALSRISGMRLVVGERPEPIGATTADPRLQGQAEQLRQLLCRRLGHCPAVTPSRVRPRGVWVQMGSPLETVWLYAPMPSPRGWPPDPLLLSLALGMGALAAVVLYLALEVQRPLRRLEGALADVGLETLPAALPARGAAAVRQLTLRFNAMVHRLEQSGRERTTMLAGIAHDLRSPLTRLRLRLSLAATDPMAAADRDRAEADLRSMERITRQFLLFAGAEAAEEPVLVPLDALVAEATAVAGDAPLELDLEPLVRRVRPTALARAVGNLLENALTHGQPPLRLVLRCLGPAEAGGEGEGGFEIQVWDRGPGIPRAQWDRALMPFQRLDRARGGQGHCGLGLAIAERVAREHGGALLRLEGGPPEPGAAAPTGFGVALRGRSLPAEEAGGGG